jgi:hypothetical protein
VRSELGLTSPSGKRIFAVNCRVLSLIMSTQLSHT